MKILVVDGDNNVLVLIRDFLAADHDVFVTRTLSEVPADAEFDLVFADYFNPLCDFEMVKSFCEKQEWPVVATSASPQPLFDRQLNKPFDAPDLKRVIQLCQKGIERFVVDSIETRYLSDVG